MHIPKLVRISVADAAATANAVYGGGEQMDGESWLIGIIYTINTCKSTKFIALDMAILYDVLADHSFIAGINCVEGRA